MWGVESVLLPGIPPNAPQSWSHAEKDGRQIQVEKHSTERLTMSPHSYRIFKSKKILRNRDGLEVGKAALQLNVVYLKSDPATEAVH